MHIITCLVGKAQMSSRSQMLRIDEVGYKYHPDGQTWGLLRIYELYTLLIYIGKLKPTIGMITYRNTCALDSKGKIAYKLILKLLPVIFLGKCSSNSNYFGF